MHNSGSHVGFPFVRWLSWYWAEQIIDPGLLQHCQLWLQWQAPDRMG
jgi:hypothetical protein